MTQSYLVSGKYLLATVPLQQSRKVKFSGASSKDVLDADRRPRLVNASNGKISNAKKWQAVYEKSLDVRTATEVRPDSFLIS